MITLTSYGLRHGDFENPVTVSVDAIEWPGVPPAMHPGTGQDKQVQTFVMSHPLVRQVVTLLVAYIDRMATTTPNAVTVAIGCKDGRHRSVAACHVVANALKAKGHEVRIHHRDLGR